jgi:hypothetical protein
MTEPEETLLLRQVAARLAETADRNQVIEELCVARNLAWKSAEEIVNQASSAYEFNIIRQQSPLLVLVAFSIYVGGVALAAWQLLGLVVVISSLVDSDSTSYWDLYNLSFGFIDTLANFPGLMFSFALGLAMVVGSYYGMKDVWLAWLDAAEPAGSRREADSAGRTTSRAPGAEVFSRLEADHSAAGGANSLVVDPKMADFILDRLEKSKSKAWVIDSIALSYGLNWQSARRLVEQVAVTGGIVFPEEVTYGPAVVLGSLGACLTGLVISLQYVTLAGAVMAPKFEQYQRVWGVSWGSLFFLKALGEYIQMAPPAFVLFMVGLAMFVGGLFLLRRVGPSVYRWQSGQLG